ncbi:ribosome maturation factor RimM [Methylobacterium organophilum]|uniref:ribosome maturation factor RimM n=1 Tax=Methylobacterium organophilum TaxID=410 RepID=UPI001F145DC8|nr:ribosome maturation factor RimM [Methylobacterium organophilum]UMY17058.1 ribosome maturation factor RimM [Methylobacterium organophilum]
MARRPGSSSRGPARPEPLGPEAVTSARKPDAAKAAKAPPPASSDPGLVLLGEFGRPHGLHGEVRLKSYTGDPLAIAGYGPLHASDGRTLELAEVRPAPGSAADLLIARVKGVSDRTGAEALNRVTLAIPRARLGAAADEDEVFLADLIGLSVRDGGGATLGTIVAVPNYGGGDLLEIRPASGGATALLPFTKAFVPVLALAEGHVVVAAPDDLFAPPGPKPADEPA